MNERLNWLDLIGVYGRRESPAIRPVEIGVLTWLTAATVRPREYNCIGLRNAFSIFLVLIGLIIRSPALRAAEAPRRYRIQQVLQLRLEDGKVVLRTELPQSNGDMPELIEIDGTDGTATVRVERETKAGLAVPTRYALSISNAERPGRSESVEVKWAQGELDVMKSVQIAAASDRGASVRLTRLVVPPAAAGAAAESEAEEEQPVHLTVNGLGRQAQQEVGVVSKDLQTLMRDHPAEANAYLRPVLRELGQEALFAPDRRLAWQVFAAQWQPEQRTMQAVRSLVSSLDDPKQAARDKATEALKRMGLDAVVALEHVDRARLSAEQNLRIDAILSAYSKMSSVEVRRLREDPAFLLDCLNSDDKSVRRAALSELTEQFGKKVQIDVDAPAAQRGDAVAALRRQLLSTTTKPAP